MNHLIMSASPGLRGKPEYGDRTTFHAVEWTVEELREHKQGKQLAVACAQYRGDHRHSNNFLQSNIIVVDIDSKHYFDEDGQRLKKPEEVPLTDAEMEEILALPLVRDHAAFVQESSNSAPDHRGLHLIFVLDQVVTDVEEYRRLVLTLQSQFVPRSDPNTKDPARLLYGSPNPVHLVQDVVLPLTSLRDLAPLAAVPEESPIVHYGARAVLPAYFAAALAGELQALRSTGKGDRNNQLNRSAFSLGQLVSDNDDCERVVMEQLLIAALEIGLTEREARTTIRSGLSAGKLSPRSAPPLPHNTGAEPPNGGRLELTEFAAAERLAQRHGQDLRYVSVFRDHGWYTWDGLTWRADPHQIKVMQLAKSVGRSYYADAAVIEDATYREAILRHAKQLLRKTTAKAVLELAATEPGMSVSLDQLNCQAHLLAVDNAVLDLRAGMPVTPSKDDLITERTEVEYDRTATCPTWDQFLQDVMGSDQELIDFLQRAVGYSLTADTREQVFFILHGTGQNGKSTFVEVVRALLGNLSLKANFSSFARKAVRGGANEDIANFLGKRFVYASEGERTHRLNESLIKDLTGGERIRARRLYEHELEFAPTFKVWLSSNHKPVIEGNDLGIWRRVVFIPFQVTISSAKRDPKLSERLQAELPGILNWALAGAAAWYKDGLNPPKQVQSATAMYRAEQDVLTQFIQSACLEQPQAKCLLKVFRERYTAWATEEGAQPMNAHPLREELLRRGFEIAPGGQGNRYIKGLGLLDMYAADEAA